MNKYKLISIILSLVSIVLIAGILYMVYGKSEQVPKSKEITTTETSSTTESKEESESTTKSSESDKTIAPTSAPQTTERTLTTVFFGKTYQLDPATGRMATADQIEVREMQERERTLAGFRASAEQHARYLEQQKSNTTQAVRTYTTAIRQVPVATTRAVYRTSAPVATVTPPVAPVSTVVTTS